MPLFTLNNLVLHELDSLRLCVHIEEEH